MTKKVKWILILILTLICGTFIFYQYQNDKEKHERLSSSGQETQIVSTYYNSWGVDFVNYYFISKQGHRIEKSEKCGTKASCDKYINATVIYNPTNPEEFVLSFDHNSYSITLRIIFFFLLYFPAMTFVSFNLIKFGVIIYRNLFTKDTI